LDKLKKKKNTLWKSIGAVVKDPLEGSCSERTQVQFIQTITYNRIIKQRMTWHETKLWTWTHTTEVKKITEVKIKLNKLNVLIIKLNKNKLLVIK